MKKFLIGFLVLLFLGASGFLGYYFYEQNQSVEEVFETQKLEIGTIIKKTVATGSINPKKEVTVKPRVSGILEKLYVQPGDIVKHGDLLGKVQIIPDMTALNNAESQLDRTNISLENARIERDRQKKLFDKGAIPERDYISAKRDYDLALEARNTARENLQIVKEGATKHAGASTTLVRATASGMVLDVPFKEGSSVIESNSFNEGTTIATIADMGEMIFIGKVDESEVGKLKSGLDLKLNVGAIDDEEFDAKLYYISPKGVEEEGAIKFEIKASITLKEGQFLRAGYSANADIVLDQKDNVLTLEESNIIFSGDTTFVEVAIGEQQFEKREIKLGLSDGIKVEVLSGISKQDSVKKL